MRTSRSRPLARLRPLCASSIGGVSSDPEEDSDGGGGTDAGIGESAVAGVGMGAGAGAVAVPRVRIDIVLNEAEITEKFVRSTGNGGQKVNKSSSRVELVHIPSGIKCSCQEARDLSTNRRWARKLLLEKLDVFYNQELSKRMVKEEKTRKRKRGAARKSKKK
eukprot:CAMPEP_0173268894 /NCGR_PEP_ID=MMETSP1142-20121109/30569_1 /TAXON_ID=483371 /ORGANISM="non described non described, Strain CCMP2298" /LENGTH=162 /DNA_ID=CAMNT_0014205165 /DNA_START=146 /DNA_END=631 /DNA_ORIENTATION=+